MSPAESPAPQAASARASNSVSLSPWVNERFPAWEQLLSAHDVARLTRRPRWIVLSLAMVGRFPRKRRFHGRGIGWLRSDVVHLLAEGLSASKLHRFSERAPRRCLTRRRPLQRCFVLEVLQRHPLARSARRGCSD